MGSLLVKMQSHTMPSSLGGWLDGSRTRTSQWLRRSRGTGGLTRHLHMRPGAEMRNRWGGGGDAHLLVSTPNRIFQFFSLPWWYGFLNTCARTAVYSIVQYVRVGGGARWLRPVCRYLALLPQPLGLLAVDVALHAGLSPGDEHGVPQGESSQSHRHRAARQEEGHHLNLGSPARPGSTFEGGVGAALTWSEPRGR